MPRRRKLRRKNFVTGQVTENTIAVQRADIVMLAVPYFAQRKLAEAVRDGLQGKILIDGTVTTGANSPMTATTIDTPVEASARLVRNCCSIASTRTPKEAMLRPVATFCATNPSATMRQAPLGGFSNVETIS